MEKHLGHNREVWIFDAEVSAVASCVRHILAACGHGGAGTLHQEGKHIFGDVALCFHHTVGYRDMQAWLPQVYTIVIFIQNIQNPFQIANRGRLQTNPCVVSTSVSSCR